MSDEPPKRLWDDEGFQRGFANAVGPSLLLWGLIIWGLCALFGD